VRRGGAGWGFWLVEGLAGRGRERLGAGDGDGDGGARQGIATPMSP